MTTLRERLQGRLKEAAGGCLEWQGYTLPGGYGRINGGKALGGRNFLTHRVAYELEFGPIPSGMKVLHSCDNPPCCNPGHLSVGTQADNIADMSVKGRNLHGVRHLSARLTESQVLEIRSRYTEKARQLSTGRWVSNAVALAREYGISTPSIYKVGRGQTWKRVAG